MYETRLIELAFVSYVNKFMYIKHETRTMIEDKTGANQIIAQSNEDSNDEFEALVCSGIYIDYITLRSLNLDVSWL